MRCEDTQAHLQALLDRELDWWTEWRVREHLHRCRACAAELSGLVTLQRVLLAGDLLGAHRPDLSVFGARPRRALRFPVTLLAPLGAAGILAGLYLAFRPGASPPVRSLPHMAEQPPRAQTPVAGPVGPQTAGIPGSFLRSSRRAGRTGARISPEPGTGRRILPPARICPLPDAQYLDGRDPELVSSWSPGNGADLSLQRLLRQSLLPTTDDFVRIPLPRLAAGDPGSPAVRDAVSQYEQEKKVVDVRLFRKVSLDLKAASLEEFCAELERQTRVKFTAIRGVRDEKVTVLVEERPAREVIREVARLFGYFWSRTGEEGAYRYALEQDLRSQIAEEEMRSRDFNAALIALDDQMQNDAALMAKGPKGGGEWAVHQLYHSLAPADFAALRRGEPLRLGSGSDAPGRSLPEALRGPVLQVFSHVGVTSVNGAPRISGSGDGTPVPDYPGGRAFITLRLNRSELGEVTLQSDVGCSTDPNWPGPQLWIPSNVATSKSPSVSTPDNARTNQALGSDPALLKKISLVIEPECKRPSQFKELGKNGVTSLDIRDAMDAENKPPMPHVQSAEVWTELHRRTGLPIVADAYTRLYPAAAFNIGKPETAFAAFCRTGDTLGARWRKDGGFILARSTSYFWDKLKEPPNRYLKAWKQDREAQGFLPLKDLLQMASLSDEQLDSHVVEQAVRHCWTVEEWGRMADLHQLHPYFRPNARFLAALGSGQLTAVFGKQGLLLGQLGPEQVQSLLRLVSSYNATDLRGAVLHAGYAPVGWYVWPNGGALPRVAEPTAEAALAAARRLDPAAGPEQVVPSEGVLSVSLDLPDGRELRYY